MLQSRIYGDTARGARAAFRLCRNAAAAAKPPHAFFSEAEKSGVRHAYGGLLSAP